MARTLLPNGKVPHITPCQCGVLCATFTGVAGGTPSLVHTVMVLSSR